VYVYDNTNTLKLIFHTHCDGSKKSIDCIGDICRIDETRGGKNKKTKKIKKQKIQKNKKYKKTKNTKNTKKQKNLTLYD
jgi:hypothetical protein